MLKLLLFAPTPIPQSLARLRSALLEECALQGIIAEAVTTHRQPEEPDTQMVTIALCTAQDVPDVSADGPPLIMLLADVHRAASPTGRLDEAASIARAIFTTEDAGLRLIGALGHEAVRVYCGYTSSWDCRPRFEERDVDVLAHLPPVHHPRNEVEQLIEGLTRFDRRVLVAGNGSVEGCSSDASTTAHAELLVRTRVILVLNDHEGPTFRQAADAILAGCAVVAEHGAHLRPLRPGDDVLFGELASLPHIAARLLSDRGRRLRMSAHAYMTLRVDLPLRNVVATLDMEARAIHGATAAIVSDVPTHN